MLQYEIIATGFPVVLLQNQAQASKQAVTYQHKDELHSHNIVNI
jgi:hypothetical protein